MRLLLPFVSDKHSLSETDEKEKFTEKEVSQNEGELLSGN